VETSPAADSETKLYEIQDGVRRAKAAHQLGKPTIPARIADGGRLGPVVEIPIQNLRAPKKVIETWGAGFSRWRKVHKAVETGAFPNGEPVPPIEVKPGSRGVPIQDVEIEDVGT
jgi:hypothetical protein